MGAISKRTTFSEDTHVVTTAQTLVAPWSNTEPFPGSTGTAPVMNTCTAQVAGRVSSAGLEDACAIDDGRRSGVAGHLGSVEEEETDGAATVVDGRAVRPAGAADGCWLEPTLVDRATAEMSCSTDEIFARVLTGVRGGSEDRVLEPIAGNPYGIGAAVVTNDGAAHRFRNKAQVGLVGINVPNPVPVASLSPGGGKGSLFGEIRAPGADLPHFFTRGTVITSGWLEPSHCGLTHGVPQSN